MKKWSLLTIFTLAIFVLAACSTAEPEAQVEPTAVSAVDSAEADAAMESDDDAAMDGIADDDDAMTDDVMMDDDAAQDAPESMDNDDAVMDDDKDSAEVMADDAAMADEAMADTETVVDEPAVDLAALPAWQTVALTNARTGESFTLADLNGQTVFVEPMATWCSNCRKQLQNVGDARAAVGDDAVFIALSLETNIDDAKLAEYAEQQGFDWTFAVMSEEILQLLADEFGRTIANAPSTPHFVIRPDGSFTDLVTGIESPEEIVEQINSAMQG